MKYVLKESYKNILVNLNLNLQNSVARHKPSSTDFLSRLFKKYRFLTS